MRLDKAALERISQMDSSALEVGARDALPVTWFKTSEGDYQVLSLYGDTVWRYSQSRFSAGTSDCTRNLDFSTIASSFRASLKALLRRYDLAETPAGNTLVGFFHGVRSFLNYLAEMRVVRLAGVNTMHCANYVDHCRRLRSKTGNPLAPGGLEKRFAAVEKLHRLASCTADAFSNPWPDTSPKCLAGATVRGPWKSKTLIIPDGIWRDLVQAANARLDEADELLDIRAKLDDLRERCRRNGWSRRTEDNRAIALVNQRGYRRLRDFESRYRELQSAAMAVILSLSGIRVHELCYLSNDAWSVTDNDGEITYWMRSRSDKTGEGDTEWMIPELVTKALDVAQRFAAPLQAQLEANRQGLLAGDPRSVQAHALSEQRERLFLVRATSGAGIAAMAAGTVTKHLHRFAAAQGIDWRFTPHQFRRTFARYVARSELGDLRYLRTHFKHWGLDMTTLYAENERQDAELYDEIMAAVRHEHVDVITHWLDEDVLITGGCADAIRAFRTGNEQLRTYRDRREMALRIADTVFIRATAAAWCTCDDGGCGGRGAIEATRCGDCANSVIDDKNLRRWMGIYQQQLELRDIQDLGPAAEVRIERDVQRCEQVLQDLGALGQVREGMEALGTLP
jgi:integrase